MRTLDRYASDIAALSRWRRYAWLGLCAAGLALPCAAHPMSLAQLLHLPLEQLLQLRIAPPRVSQPGPRPAAEALRQVDHHV